MTKQDKEELLLALINKGGSAPARANSDGSPGANYDSLGIIDGSPGTKVYSDLDEIKNYQLRMPKWLIKRIDDQCNKRDGIYMSRHQWIINAILNEFAKEE